MRSFPRHLAFVASLFLLLLPARSTAQAVIPINEKDYRATLNNLLPELKQSYSAALESDSLLVNNTAWRAQLAEMVKSADEITIMLYTQRPEFAFDMAFALENADRLRTQFQEQVLLSAKYLTVSRSGLRRYTLLEETLREMYLEQPADTLQADSLLVERPLSAEDLEKQALLDSCLRYTAALNALYGESVSLALQDSVYFADTEERLQQAYDYAQADYAETQKNRYIGGNVTIGHILKNWKTFLLNVQNDLHARYYTEPVNLKQDGTSAWAWSGRYVLTYAGLSLLVLLLSFLLAGLISHLLSKYVHRENILQFRPILSSILAVLLFAISMLVIKVDRGNPYWQMAFTLLTQFAWLTLAIFVSLLIRIRSDQAKASRNIYVPTLLLAFLSILSRAIFLPASMVPLAFPPILLVFIIWQTAVNIRYRREVSSADLRYMWVSVGVMAATGILSLAGYAMIGVLVLTCWTFLLALLHTITTLFYLMKRYYENWVIRRKARYHKDNPLLPLEDKNAFIEVTWLYDLLRMVVLPLTTLLSFPVSMMLTSRAYQLSLAGADLLRHPIFKREGYGYLTPYNLIIVIALFFIFRYLIYLVKALSRVIKLRRTIEKNPSLVLPLKESDVNLTLPNTIFSLLGWFLFLVISFSILRLPTRALTYITTGLAAGVGFALKDLINNFFYGIQLMAGRIRVGDKISCDGVRGIVKAVSYQTTQVEDEDGSVIAFTNTDLFTKKFKNLNTGRNYELLKIPVCVSYGTDIGKVRNTILEALKPLMTKDKYGRDIIDPSTPIDIRVDKFADSSVNLFVVLYTTVETHYTFPARALEAIYNAFHENGIEIPFPQRDVHIKSTP